MMTSPRSQHRRFFRKSWVLAAGFLTACSSHPGTGDRADWRKQTALTPYRNQVLLPDFMADPYEPVNRGLWAVNKGLLVGVMQPTGRVYRKVVPTPVRGSIKDFTRNITYPGRAINHALQGRWSGAGDETTRFLVNTTAGVGGLFDVASKWDMPKSDADFGQTFGKWGWIPQAYVVLPVIGPSDDRHAIGAGADKLAEPWNYQAPYIYASYTSGYNQAAERAEDASRLVQTESDSYALVKYAWSYGSKDRQPDWQLRGQIDPSTLQTLGAVRIACNDPEFPVRAREMSARIPSTGRSLKFNYWLQPGTAPLVYISPGLSSHRLSATTLSLAEHLYQNGYSVVTTTSVFHPDFMEHASTAELPVYPPVDSHDLHVALTEMDRTLVKRHPDRFGKRALVGLSMGGFLTLRLAAHENRADSNLLRFDRYVAINAPVDLIHGALRVDDYQDAPMAWPAGQRQELINNTLHKAAAVGALTTTANTVPPFDGTESKYLIGITFRISLRDIIFSSQTRHNRGVLETPLSKWRREAGYEEIMSYSYKDYFLKFAVPYYQAKGVGLGQLMREGNLRAHGSLLRKQPKVRILANRNDFLLSSEDLSWLRSTFAPSQLAVFPDGGHLGNLATPPVQKAALESLRGL